MKHYLLTGLSILLAGNAQAQDRDSLLIRINSIKMDTEHYLYGICTITDETSPEASIQEARNALKESVNDYLAANDFRYIKEANAKDISYISCPLYPACFRTIAYVPISRLKEDEQLLTKQKEDVTRKEALRSLLSQISGAKTIGEIETLITHCSLGKTIPAGHLLNDTSQEYVEHSYFVYYHPKTGVVLEIMLPPNAQGVRRNLSTRALSDPLRYKTTPFWFFLEDL